MADDLAVRQDYYMPRPLVTLTIGAETKRYSTETLVMSEVGGAEWGGEYEFEFGD